ncbi:MAG TPA: hypothetical protein VGN35_03965 [Jatrophihabitantaceae bacterium]|jgi:hypothetical protein|nr:hypothetical protein [Jatrophihabitantaceae bacterium]
MSVPRRVLILAEMHGRDLVRRHVALALLIALPLFFYLSSEGNGPQAMASGGIGMAFAIAGPTLFSVLSSRDVDQRLVLGGYRPFELMLGRLLFLAPLSLALSAAFAALMAGISHPKDAWIFGGGVAIVGLQAVVLGLAIGALVPRELEGTLVLIGVVGIQLAARHDSVVAKCLPFYGPRRLIDVGITGSGPMAGPVLQTLLYAAALLLIAELLTRPRLAVRRHATTAP